MRLMVQLRIVSSQEVKKAMRFYLDFTCRSCGEDARVSIDSSNLATNQKQTPIELHCQSCNHVSALLGISYHFTKFHIPPHERRK